MSVTSGFFDSKNKDRLYNTEQLSSIFDGIIKDGVYMGYEDAFIVKATSPASLTVNVGPGRAWFHHTWTHNDAPLPIVVKQGDVVLNRIDSIVIDIDKTEDVRDNKIICLEGTPSSEATAPVLVNEEKHWQIPLCNISMPAGSTTITQAQITNRIGTSDCPFVTGIIETIETDELLAQWNAEYREWYARVQQEIDQWTEQEQADFTEWMNGRKTEFDAWFAGIQDILDGDVAGNLLNRINHRTGINATATYSEGVVAITAPDDAGEILTFVAPSDFLSSDTYTLNGEALTITDLNGEALDEAWKKDSPITITVSGGKAFFKAGGSGKNDTLPPLLGNMTVEVVEGDENDTYTIKMDKLILDKTTEMVGGAQLEWGEEMPAKPGKGTGGIKTWTRDKVITTDKPYDEPDNSPQVTHTVEVPHGQKVVFRQFTQNQKKQFQTMLVGGVYPPLGDVEPPFKLPEFTGNHAIFGDETAGRIELYESGTLTLSPGTYDFFLVGGGASGGVTTDTSVQEHTGGGGGGYTTTISDIVVSKRSEFIATVGAGGNRSAGSQTIFENGSTTIKYTANGGAMVTGEYTANGGAGGSGGGGFNRDSGNGYAGGSDGSNGLGRTGGMGQGTTTRMFGEAGNTLFSGGGGGAGDGRGYYPGAGGAGGGGAAGNNVNGVAGTANTGGGGGGYSTVNTSAWLQPGAGGSGIIIVRWDNAAQ